MGDGEFVVFEVDGFIFEGYSDGKHQDGGNDGDKCLEVWHGLDRKSVV